MANVVEKVPAAAVAAGGLVGGYATARFTKKRPLGGAVLAVAGAAAAQQWRRQAGPKTAAALSAAYVAGFAASHPLAKKVGAWPAVLGVAGSVALASWVAVDRRR
ncbi:membrane protein [Streptomyces alboflavus]|uniref:Membrane protein n=1 Tax=Streptomyces alboflavus TaxID=67267 RepID=A0A1Z1WBK1_9ACTN|nr:membrane protein [Streptomyces alboflavus]